MDNNILIMCKTTSWMVVCKKASIIRQRTVPLSCIYSRESTEKWDLNDLKNDVNGYETDYHVEMSCLNELIMKHQREGYMLYNEHKMIYEISFNTDCATVDYMKERLRNGGCFLSKAKKNPPASALFGLTFASRSFDEQPATRYSN